MHDNLLKGMGQADLLAKVIEPYTKILLEREDVIVSNYVESLLKVYFEHGDFGDGSYRKMYDRLQKDIEDGKLNYVVRSSDELYLWLQNYFYINDYPQSHIRRHMVYIPYGIMFEQGVEIIRPEWTRTVGEDDYWGKVDFIDYEEKVLHTLKTNKYVDEVQLYNQIKTYWANKPEKDFKIVFSWRHPGKVGITKELKGEENVK